jgi:hypothetical protein
VPVQRARGGRGVEDAEHLAGADGQQPAVGHGPTQGGAGHGEVRRQRLRRRGLEVGHVGADGLHVAANDRAREGRVAVLERVVEGGGQQRAERGGRVLGAGGGEDLHRLGDEGDEVVGTVGETRVVERAAVLRDPHRATAQVGHQRLREPAVGVGGGHAEHAAGQAGQVDLGAGEGHRGVQGNGAGTDLPRRLEHGQAVPTARVRDDLPLADRTARAQHRDDVGQHVVRDREQQQVAGARDVGRLGDGDAGQQVVDATA